MCCRSASSFSPAPASRRIGPTKRESSASQCGNSVTAARKRRNTRLVIRRLRAAVTEFPHWDAELSRFVGPILLDAGAGENEDADRQHIVALERRGLGVFGQAQRRSA